jgi:predicted unusual protein kinase regulating ubiquinone biosynthesis (AarF/ABC1/UbiB family)
MAMNKSELLHADRFTMKPKLESLIQELGRRPIPVGRFHRARLLGTAQAKIASTYLTNWVSSRFKGFDAREQKLAETRLKAAVELLGNMAYLRGTVMKVGQFIASYPDLAPEEIADVLYPLHFEAPPMHFSLLREFVCNELGAEPEDIFDEFETKAFAAASLGQVHKARLKGSGKPVAIKVQYPSIGRTIRDDFRNLLALLLPLRLSGDWDNLKLQLEDVRSMLERETDYEREAENLSVARAAFHDEEGIVIPKVYSEFSTKRLLTMEFVEGVHLDSFLRGGPSQQLRDEFGRKMFLAFLRLRYGINMVYGDPQAGNYFFMPDGRLGIVDFGCCHYMTEEDLDYVNEVEAALQTSSEALREATRRAGDERPDRRLHPEQVRLVEQMAEWLWEPLEHEGPFDFGDPEYFNRGSSLLAEILRGGHVRSRPVNTWLNRNYIGLRALLLRLKARVDCGALIKKETTVTLPRPGG